MPKPDQETAVILKHHGAAGHTQIHWAVCYLGATSPILLLCQRYQICGSSTAELDWWRYRETLITHSKWLQTVISIVLGAGKGLLFLDLSQKHFKLLQCLSLKRQKAPVFQWCQCSFLIAFTQVSPNDTPGPCFALQYTYAVTYFKNIYILCICKYTYFAFMHVIQVSLSEVYKIRSFTGPHACLLHT